MVHIKLLSISYGVLGQLEYVPGKNKIQTPRSQTVSNILYICITMGVCKTQYVNQKREL